MSCFLVTSKRRGPDGREGSGAQAQRGGMAAQGNPGRPLWPVSLGPARTGAGSGNAGETVPAPQQGRAGTRAGGKGKEAGVALACAGGFRNEHEKVSSDRWFNQEKQCDYVSKCRERKRWRAERKATASSAPLRSQKMSAHTHFTTAD